MWHKLAVFWSNFWASLKTAYHKTFKSPPKSDNLQDFRDTKRINFLAMLVGKINDLVNNEASFVVESDNTQTAEIDRLLGDLESKRYTICDEMLGAGEVWIFPAHNERGEIYHRLVNRDKVRIIAMDGERVTDVIAIIDEYIDEDHQVFFLNRRHILMGDVLTIETYTTNVQNVRVKLDEWAGLESIYQFNGVDTIGAGRFKNTTSSRGKSPVYGVPINFGCREIEATIFNDLKLIEDEFSNAQSKIFADPFILRKGRDKVGNEGYRYRIPENIFPIDTRGGQTNASIDIFNPNIRYTALREKLMDDLARYEQQVGVDKGFLSQFENKVATTATEIRRANASTIAFIGNVREAVKRGVLGTIKADAMLLNISEDLYTVLIDWYDTFSDEQEQYQRLAGAVDRGIAEKKDELRWLFPNLTDDELEEKLARVAEERKQNAQNAMGAMSERGGKKDEDEGENKNGRK